MGCSANGYVKRGGSGYGFLSAAASEKMDHSSHQVRFLHALGRI